MDLLGTKRFLEKIEATLGVTLPKADADLEKLGAVLDEAGVFLGEATDLVQSADALVDSLPEEMQKFRKPLLAFLDHFVRVGTRASIAAQEATQMMTDVRELIADIREFGFETKSRIAKPESRCRNAST